MRFFLIFLIALTFTVSGQADSEKRIATAEDFLADPDFWTARLSEDGSKLAVVRTQNDQLQIVTLSLDNAEAGASIIPIPTYNIQQLEWVTNERLVITLAGYERQGKVIPYDQVRVDPHKRYAFFTRHFFVDASGDNPVMFADGEPLSKGYSSGGIVSLLPHDPDHILVIAYLSKSLNLYKA
ncbi:MAG: hypothetical protein AAGJ85_02755, partial [Pseudomonadota bacterium]